MKIWSYWEGPKPKWIEMCHHSLIHNGGHNVEILDWNSFSKLWTHDTDLPIKNLYVAHQADFIRAYLIKHFGGVWVDADCLIMKNMSPLLATCKEWDFFYYRQKSGSLSNAFIGAKTDSITADHFYRGVRWRLRQPEPLGWLDIGSHKMDEAISAAGANCLQLAQEMVAPFDWNEGQAYLQHKSEEEHKVGYNNRPLCHMLSNHSLKGSDDKVNACLVDDRSYFTYLFNLSCK